MALARMVTRLLADLIGLLMLTVRRRRSIEAENLVLRRQLALFKESGVKPRRIDAATRLSLAWLSRLCDWGTVKLTAADRTESNNTRLGHVGAAPPTMLRHSINRRLNACR
jgi:hypothetical protein